MDDILKAFYNEGSLIKEHFGELGEPYSELGKPFGFLGEAFGEWGIDNAPKLKDYFDLGDYFSFGNYFDYARVSSDAIKDALGN